MRNKGKGCTEIAVVPTSVRGLTESILGLRNGMPFATILVNPNM